MSWWVRDRLPVTGCQLSASVLCLAAVLFLAGCGFTPLYGTKGAMSDPAVSGGLNRIYIENIPDREGQYLRNSLIDRFYTHGRPDHALYNLKIEPVRQTITDLDITKGSDATRAQLRLNTLMVLADRQSGAVLLKRELVSITSYNILQSQFTTRVSEQNARENALDDLAHRIEQQLALYFSRAK